MRTLPPRVRRVLGLGFSEPLSRASWATRSTVLTPTPSSREIFFQPRPYARSLAIAFPHPRFTTRILCLSPRRKYVQLVPWRIGRRLIYFVVIDTLPRFVVPFPA
jgi:hypothetical protein